MDADHHEDQRTASSDEEDPPPATFHVDVDDERYLADTAKLIEGSPAELRHGGYALGSSLHHRLRSSSQTRAMGVYVSDDPDASVEELVLSSSPPGSNGVRDWGAAEHDQVIVLSQDGETFIAPSSPRRTISDPVGPSFVASSSPRRSYNVPASGVKDADPDDDDDGYDQNGIELKPLENSKHLELLEEGKASDDEGNTNDHEVDRNSSGLMEVIDAKLELEEEGKKVHSVLGLVAMVFFLVCGGAYGTEDLGGSIPPLFALAGIITIPWIWSLPMAMMTAELASAMPSHSGFILWGTQAWGPLVPFVDGWIMVVVAIVDQALYPLIFVDYLQEVVTLNAWQSYLISLAYIAFACFLNIMGAKIIDRSAQFFSLSSLFPFILFVILGLFSSHYSPTALFDTSDRKSNVGLYLSVLIWATCGYEYSGFLAGNVKNPRRTYPIAMLLSVVLMLITYLFPIATAIATTKDWSIDIVQGSYPVIAKDLGFGSWLLYLMIIGGLVSTMGTYNAYLHTSSTALHSLSKDGMAPSVFQHTSNRFSTPVPAILFFSITTCVLVLFDFSYLVEVESFLYSIHAFLLCATFIYLGFKQPQLKIPSILPFGRLGVLVCGLLPSIVLVGLMCSLFYSDYRVPLVGMLITAFGPLLYYAQTKMPSVQRLLADQCYYRYFAVRQI